MLAVTRDKPERTECRIYDSLEELINHAMKMDSASIANRNVAGLDPDYFKNNGRFVGRSLKTWEKARATASELWQEGLDAIESMLQEIDTKNIPAPVSRKRRTRFSEIEGAELDYDRLRSGQEFWRITRRESTSAPANLTISVDVAANARRSAETLLWRGIAAIVLCEILEASGYRVELWMHDSSTNAYTDGTNCLTMVRLKALSDPLDRSTLVNSISGWFFRSVLFSELTQSHEGRHAQTGLGKHRLPTQDELSEFTHDPETLVINEVWDRKDAALLVRSTLVKRFLDK